MVKGNYFIPLLTAIENVSFPMKVNGLSLAESMPRAAKFLEDVGIESEKHKQYPANLSGGEQQRVAIARADQILPMKDKTLSNA